MSKSTIEFEMGNIKKIYDTINDSIIEFILNNIKNYNKTEFFYLTFNKDNFIQSTLYDSKNPKKEYLFEEWDSGKKSFVKTYDNIDDVLIKTNYYLNLWRVELEKNNTERKKNSKKNKKSKSNKKNNNIILDDYEKNNENKVLKFKNNEIIFEMNNYIKSYENFSQSDIDEILSNIKYYKKDVDKSFKIFFGNENNFIKSNLCSKNTIDTKFIVEKWNLGEMVYKE